MTPVDTLSFSGSYICFWEQVKVKQCKYEKNFFFLIGFVTLEVHFDSFTPRPPPSSYQPVFYDLQPWFIFFRIHFRLTFHSVFSFHVFASFFFQFYFSSSSLYFSSSTLKLTSSIIFSVLLPSLSSTLFPFTGFCFFFHLIFIPISVNFLE